eukprot:354195-Chlamydomonas_euryale.AAC.6
MVDLQAPRPTHRSQPPRLLAQQRRCKRLRCRLGCRVGLARNAVAGAKAPQRLRRRRHSARRRQQHAGGHRQRKQQQPRRPQAPHPAQLAGSWQAAGRQLAGGAGGLPWRHRSAQLSARVDWRYGCNSCCAAATGAAWAAKTMHRGARCPGRGCRTDATGDACTARLPAAASAACFSRACHAGTLLNVCKPGNTAAGLTSQLFIAEAAWHRLSNTAAARVPPAPPELPLRLRAAQRLRSGNHIIAAPHPCLRNPTLTAQ